ncbi:hypothetical protein [Tumebacillus lipolyticus]|uniref:Zinc ribbon domain-containing protein n=1 Tax=Tumebacillus lipolyticus TaxID=1280370 RepID=A0ABW4ZX87_9BACL
MNRWIWVLSMMLILGGASCLAVSANGPWGFALFGFFCWVSPLFRILLLVAGVLVIGGIAIRGFYKASARKSHCPRCHAVRLQEWSLCYRCGHELSADNHKKITNL